MNNKKSIMILFLSFGIVGIYGFPYMKGTFYNVIKAALKLSDIQLSRIWGAFGTVGMLSYVMGGYFTDRFSPKKILIAALVVSSILHLYVSFVPSYLVVLLISGLMGLSAVFAFFPASSNVLSSLGSNHNAGSVFGVYYALEGLSQLIRTIELVQERLNPDLEIEGVVFTMYDARTNLSLQVVENVKDNLEQNIYKTIIPRNIRLAEAPSFGTPINQYDPRSAGAESYMRLAEEVISKES